jgi:hypothetical protein
LLTFDGAVSNGFARRAESTWGVAKDTVFAGHDARRLEEIKNKTIDEKMGWRSMKLAAV